MKSKIFDMRSVTCGLVPAIVSQLGEVSEPVVDFHIRPGIREEIMSGFGSGGEWDIEIISAIGFDVLRFTPKKKCIVSDLNIVEY
ncbi:hypothetical protein SAMN05660337_1538 [Maridesulfovibrio ferrireducens]|uniref:Uncharacterized protein n=1 Tax=Maridesulfovibrio ferrireducens TaxID=246191 RepID=A0A1G9FH65_9BACT|nr:hypothetical protein [Maridesulfovibrio ferrireducens]SDK87738.1 hypothetical protein SAMN05660337_1538 [Maridesulfovibrio ferrireducens]